MIPQPRLAGIALLILAVTTQASAATITYTDDDIGSFVPDSSFDTPAFQAAIGTPDEFLSFSQDKFGNPRFDGDVDGAIYSDNVLFSSSSSTTFGGINSPNVNHTFADGPNSEIGPASGFDGILNIDFLAAGNTASIVGFGPVEFGTLEFIRVYDQTNTLILSQPGVSDISLWTFFGVQGTGGTQIGRIELEGEFFAIQDIQFDLAVTSEVPEPTSMALFGLTALGMGVVRRRRKAGDSSVA